MAGVRKASTGENWNRPRRVSMVLELGWCTGLGEVMMVIMMMMMMVVMMTPEHDEIIPI